MVKRAFVTGITGQDGSYLAELLLEKGYEVHGLVRRSSTINRGRIDHIADPDLHLHYGDLTDGVSIVNLIHAIEPHEVYNLGAQSHVKVSFEMPEYTASTDGIGALRLLEAIRAAEIDCRFYQASTSEMFGASAPPQNETTPFHPRSPYGAAKLYAHYVTTNYREAYGVFACSGILFNHESPRRGENFLTRKVTLGVAAIVLGVRDSLQLGNLDAVRDWGYAPEYVEGMWRMLQQDEPGDFVLATGQGRTVRQFVQTAFEHAGLDWEQYVTHDEQYERPTEVHSLIGDPSRAREVLGWKAETDPDQLARLMVDADIEQLRRLLGS
ncbi:GDP-mannose 4,6-dehydratase [Nocardioides anomalus]|uniref:GDP-mannose 4,6-dehydratase n=1 Tax=Nocardioides anomalus TaxID=2712223 RepID=A0A6G6WHJ3_9ACTN|nr:GDP-mannose 4,6-dehydratase [Nocardioides anomalus]QIG44676.1 GDP-mannose 4,6-dehydratase [Nocardioides anomalus]